MKSSPISPRNDKLFLASQFLYACVFTIPIWIAYYQTKITLTEVSFLTAIQYASQLFLELPTGAFADMFGRKASVIVGYLAWAVTSIIVILAPGFQVIAVAAIMGGLAESFLSGSMEALVYDSHKQDGTEREFSKMLAKNNILFQFGLITGTVTGGFLYHVWYGLPFLTYAVFCIGAAFLSLFMIEPKVDSEKFTLKNYLKQIVDGTKHAFETRRTTLVSLYYIAVAGITWTVNLYFFDLALTQLFSADQLRGIIGATIRFINILVITFLVKNDKIFTRKVSIWFFPLTMSIGYFGSWLFFKQAYIVLVFLGLSIMAGTARWVILSKYTNECFESKYRATALSALSMLVGLVYIIITSTSGFFMTSFGGVSVIFLLLGVGTILAVLPLAGWNVGVIERE